MRIGRASVDDLEQVHKLYSLLFKNEIDSGYDKTLSLRWSKGMAAKKHFSKGIVNKNMCILVAKENGKVIGYLSGWLVKFPSPYRKIKRQAELGSMFVLKKFRNRKIGSDLMKTFVKWSKRKGAENICVRVSVPNVKAIEFYNNCGYKGYELILEKNLKASGGI